MTGEHMVVMLVRVEQELWFPGVPLASIIHVSEGRTATQPVWLQEDSVVLHLDLTLVSAALFKQALMCNKSRSLTT